MHDERGTDAGARSAVRQAAVLPLEPEEPLEPDALPEPEEPLDEEDVEDDVEDEPGVLDVDVVEADLPSLPDEFAEVLLPDDALRLSVR